MDLPVRRVPFVPVVLLLYPLRWCVLIVPRGSTNPTTKLLPLRVRRGQLVLLENTVVNLLFQPIVHAVIVRTARFKL